MTYPQIIDYNDAVQTPLHAFSDPVLRAGQVATTPLGLPLALSGGFALTYTIQSRSGKLAVRCFHREMPSVQQRYAAVSRRLRSIKNRYFVDFEFQPEGIRVNGTLYPIVKMDWAEGDTLGVYLDRKANDLNSLSQLRQAFAKLAAYLEQNSIAHGDISNDNVIVELDQLRLIDYDGMFVPGMQQGQGTEIGHKHFQHPQRDVTHFGPAMDRFSFITIDLSLLVLSVDPSLHKRFREGGQTILFRANDFADPMRSEIFSELEKHAAVRDDARKLALLCRSDIATIPSLADFRAERNLPVSRLEANSVASTAAAPQPYISAAPLVLNTDEFDAVLREVGQRVELIGKVVSVRRGVGRRGRGKGQPYVFINFANWLGNCVKITIWSDGLTNLTDPPDERWVGRWISVTGMIEPPYEGSSFGRPYRHIGITVGSDGQIVRLTKTEAAYRLGRKKPHSRTQGSVEPAPKVAKPWPSTPNKAIFDRIQNGHSGLSEAPRQWLPQQAPPAQSASASNPSMNKRLLEAIHAKTPQPIESKPREVLSTLSSNQLANPISISPGVTQSQKTAHLTKAPGHAQVPKISFLIWIILSLGVLFWLFG